ncbi:hypothetical protein HDF11_003406 [Tunturiibacter psychrotolerans]
MAGKIEQRIGFSYGHVHRTVRNLDDLVLAPDITFFQNAKVEARPVMRHEERCHTRFVHANTDAVASNAWLSHLEESVPDPISISNADLIIGETIDCEIFAELSKREIASPELFFPIAVRVYLVYEDCAMLAPVTCKIALTIAFNVNPSHETPPLNGTLPYPGVDYLSFPLDIAWETDVH